MKGNVYVAYDHVRSAIRLIRPALILGFRDIKRLRVFQLLLDEMPGHHRLAPPVLSSYAECQVRKQQVASLWFNLAQHRNHDVPHFVIVCCCGFVYSFRC